MFDKGTHKNGATPARTMHADCGLVASSNGGDVEFLGHGNVGGVDHGHVDSA